MNQLIKVEYPTYSEELFYDRAGNRTCRTRDGIEELYQYDPRNRLTALTKGGTTTSFQYDHAGNLLKDDRGEYTYDAFNRTIKAETFDGNIQVNHYDAEGLRAEVEENEKMVAFIFNQDKDVVAEMEHSEVRRFIRTTSLIARSTDVVRMYYHYASDEMGSTTHITDEEGEILNWYKYDAWGNITEQEENVLNRFKFTGEQFDPVTQQYYLRARYYNPVIARFTQEDTYRGAGLNLYTYCSNNPVYYVDPSGNMTQCQKDALNKPGGEGDSGTVPNGYYQDANGKWHRPDGKFASNAEVGLPAPKPPSSDGTGGRLGNEATREQNRQIADYLEGEGYDITGGGGREAEEYLAGPNGGNKGSNYLDVTATKDGEIVRINTVDVGADGKTPTNREQTAASSIDNKTGGTTILIPKGEGIGGLPNILGNKK